MADYVRKEMVFRDGGIQTNRPVNLVDEGKYPYLLNVHKNIAGALQSRFGFQSLYVAPPMHPNRVHTLRRINNIAGATPDYARLVGIDDSVFLGQNDSILQLVGGGNSGNPLSVIPYRPLQSPETWAYVADVNRMRKYALDGFRNWQMGIIPPSNAPTVELAGPLYTDVDDFETTSGWSATGIAASLTATSRIPTDSVVAGIQWDDPAIVPGWACVVITNPVAVYSAFGVGSRIKIGAFDVVVISEVFPQLSNTTIASIIYDSGASGLCTIQTTTPYTGLLRNQLLTLNSAENVRVLSVATSPDGLYSFRCFATGTHLPGETVISPFAVRMFLYNIYAPGTAITNNCVGFTSTPAGGASEGSISRAFNADLSHVVERPLGLSDYLHISVQVDNPLALVEGRVYLDLAADVNDFQHEARYFSFRPGDFAGSATGSTSTVNVRQTAVQNQQIDSSPVNLQQNYGSLNNFSGGDYVSLYRNYPSYNSGVMRPPVQRPPTYFKTPSQGTQPITTHSDTPTSIQTAVGASAWTELFIPLAKLVPIGTDTSRTYNAMKGVKIYTNCSAPLVTHIDSMWIGGGFGPDVSMVQNGSGYTGQPYLYRYRYRSSTTGATSIPSPAPYSGVLPIRGRVFVTPEASPDPQVDKIDIERLGGFAADEFHYVGTCQNFGGVVYLDDIEDTSILNATVFDEDNYAPFPVDDFPAQGTCNVSGTSVQWVTGTPFNTHWAPGAEIIIDQNSYVLSGPPRSATLLMTVESIGAKTNVAFLIPNPTIFAKPLPAMWGPLHEMLFACGDDINPGMVYFTKPNDPDSASDQGFVEVTSPSEPMMNGCIFEGSSIAFSTEYAYRLEPSNNTANQFTPVRLASGRGLFARFGLCVGPKIWFVGRDGIYEYAADGGAISITNADLYNLFPHVSQPGTSVTVQGNTLPAVDYRQPFFMRLSYGDSWLYFDYLGVDQTQYTLAYNILDRTWWPFSYTPPVTLHATEEGTHISSTMLGFVDGTVGTVGGTSDGINPITCIVKTPSLDMGDNRATKQFGDLTLDVDDPAASIALVVGFDNNLVTVNPQPATASVSGRKYGIYDLESGVGDLYRNIALDLQWTTNEPIILYSWQVSWLVKPEFTILRATDYDQCGHQGNKWVQGCRITCDTRGITRRVKIQSGGGFDTGIILNVKAIGETTLPFSWTPIYAHELRLIPLDLTGSWRVMNIEWVIQPAPETASTWLTQFTTHGLRGYQHLREFYIQYRTSAPAIFTVATEDGRLFSFPLPAAPTTRKPYIVSYPIKGKSFQYGFTGDPDLQIYQGDCEVRLKEWGVPGPYISARPFGDMTTNTLSTSGARI